MSRRNPCGDLTCDECRPPTVLGNVEVYVWPTPWMAAVRSIRELLEPIPHRPRPLPIDGAAYRRRTRARRKR